MWYNVDINRLTELLTPTFLRKGKHLAWLRALHYPLVKILDNFNFSRSQNLYMLTHSGQVCYLRKALNDRFDISQRRIRITDGNRYQREYIYTLGEQKPKFLGVMYLRSKDDYGDTGVNFIVEAPKDLKYNAYEMKHLIEFYKLASKRYKIEHY